MNCPRCDEPMRPAKRHEQGQLQRGESAWVCDRRCGLIRVIDDATGQWLGQGQQESKREVHVLKRGDGEQVEITIYHLPALILLVVFERTIAQQEDAAWMQAFLPRVPNDGRPVLTIGSDGWLYPMAGSRARLEAIIEPDEEDSGD